MKSLTCAEKCLKSTYQHYFNKNVFNMGQIYKIENVKNGKFYIGSSINYKKRFRNHIYNMRRGTHHNIHMQRTYDKYGSECFVLSLIEETDDLFGRERYWIDRLQPDYNIGGVCGGDNYSKHPDKELLKIKLTEQLLSAPRPKPRYKEANGNWRGGTTFCGCGNKKAHNAKFCGDCRDRCGENNPFYGQNHTEETKKKLSNYRTGKYSGNQERKVYADGVIYKSVAECARAYDFTTGAIIYRIKKEKFDFHYIE